MSVGVGGGSLEIKDRTTGAVGTYDYLGQSLSFGLPYVPVDGEFGTGWKEFRTEEAVSLRAFEDFVRFPSFDLFIDALSFSTIQFSSVDIDHESLMDQLAYGDGVSLQEITEGLELGISYEGGLLKLRSMFWDELDEAMEAKLRGQDLAEALKEALLDLADWATTSQLPEDAYLVTERDVQEWQDQQSVPDPEPDYPISEPEPVNDDDYPTSQGDDTDYPTSQGDDADYPTSQGDEADYPTSQSGDDVDAYPVSRPLEDGP